MEIVVALGVLCAIVLLGFAALIYLKHAQDRALLKDLLDARLDIVEARKQSVLSTEICAQMANKVKENMDQILAKMSLLQVDASGAKIATETILREYELNGVPMGYQRGNNYDALDGV